MLYSGNIRAHEETLHIKRYCIPSFIHSLLSRLYHKQKVLHAIYVFADIWNLIHSMIMILMQRSSYGKLGEQVYRIFCHVSFMDYDREGVAD
jgi:uncharacterized membrane protein YagU involved in acid resistance